MNIKSSQFCLVALALLIFVACSSVNIPIPTQADAERGARLFADLTLESLNQGKADHDRYCNTCHNYKPLEKYTTEQWEKIVPKMASKAAKKAGREVIDAVAQESIRKYVVTMCDIDK
ncbi:hypothetical protein MASR2M18_00520 [Ignavibacteria bacterium]|nr:hypothetical protein [Bacteroidota bacterium]MCZ2131925.1 hypothetical protein [Bacteroidota bacterium]